MAAKYTPIVAPDGLLDAIAVLTVVQDEDLKKETVEFLAKIDASIADYNARIAAVGKIDEIEAFHAAAAADRHEARVLLEAAHKEAVQVRREAAEDTAARRAVLDAAEEKLNEQQSAFTAQMAVDISAFEARKAAHDSQHASIVADCEKREQHAAAALAEGTALKEEFQRKVEGFRRVATEG